MASEQQETLAVGASEPGARESRLAALRGNCMGAAVLVIVQVAVGIGVNLYITVPRDKSFLAAVFGSAALAAHVIVAVALLGAAISALVRAVRLRAATAIVLTSAGLASVLAAAAAGASFVNSGSNGASLAMGLAAAVAMFCYLAAVFSQR